MLRRISVLASALVFVGGSALHGGSTALADKTSPAVKDTTIKVDIINVAILISLKAGGDPKPYLLTGVLHAVSQVTMDGNGMATEFKLHLNLSGATAVPLVPGGTVPCSASVCPAVGVVDLSFLPPAPVSPSGFALLSPAEFHVVKLTDTSSPAFTLQVETTYDATGALTTVQVVQNPSGGGCLVPCKVV